LPVGNYGHLALPHLKSTLEEIWNMKGEVLEESSYRKFRSDDQVNQWLCCAWNQAKGCFFLSLEENLGLRIVLTPKTIEIAYELIKNQTIPQICINDTSLNTDYKRSCERMQKAFSYVLPERSSFEKY
jgi:hypothetical protein